MQTLKHSIKGSTWKKHKYIRKEGDRYIYDSKIDYDKLPERSTKDAEENLKKYQDRLDRQKSYKLNLEIKKSVVGSNLVEAYEKIHDKTLSSEEIDFYKQLYKIDEMAYSYLDKRLNSVKEFMEINSDLYNEAYQFLIDLKELNKNIRQVNKKNRSDEYQKYLRSRVSGGGHRTGGKRS